MNHWSRILPSLLAALFGLLPAVAPGAAPAVKRVALVFDDGPAPTSVPAGGEPLSAGETGLRATWTPDNGNGTITRARFTFLPTSIGTPCSTSRPPIPPDPGRTSR